MKQIYKGSLFLNGNVQYEHDLFTLLEDYFKNPVHTDPEINEANNILLVTTAWRKTEFDCHHVHDALVNMNISSNIDNLSAYSYFREFEKKEAKAYRQYHKKQIMLRRFKLPYYAENAVHIDEFFERLGIFIEKYDQLDLDDIFKLALALNNKAQDEFISDSSKAKQEQYKMIVQSQEDMEDVLWFRNSIIHMSSLDRKLIRELRQLEEEFFEKAGIRKLPLYIKMREEMKERILSSAAIVIFGGSVYTLNNRLRFFDLGPVFMEALKRGTNVYGISAGTICLMKDFYMNDDLNRRHGFVASEDFGLGFVKSLNLFPHANDYPYLMDKERFRNYIAYLGLRTFHKIPVGLETQSIMKCDIFRNNRRIERHFTSLGPEPCYIYLSNGDRVDLMKNEKLVIHKGSASLYKNNIEREAKVNSENRGFHF